MTTEQDGGAYTNDYHSPVSTGCFTQVVYKQHSHVSSCYTTATCGHPSVSAGGGGEDGEGKYRWWASCNVCGYSVTVANNDASYSGGTGDAKAKLWGRPQSYSKLICGKSQGGRYESEGIDYYACSCGHLEGQIVKAEIMY